MMRLAKMAAMISCGVALTGCFQVERVVTVKPDGSGTVEETMLLSKKALAAMTSAFGNGQQQQTQQQQTDDFDLVKEDDLKKAAAGMGEGVRYLKSSKISDEKFVGYRVVYAFNDINKLLVDKGPPKMEGQPGVVDASKAAQFSFTPGSPATLVIKGGMGEHKVAAPETEEAPPAPAGEPNPQDMAMLKEMFDGMRFAMSVVVDGNIIKTNATHREGNRIILADVDFSKILSMPEKDLARLKDLNLKDGDMDAAMAVLREFPGMKVDLNDEVRVTFK